MKTKQLIKEVEKMGYGVIKVWALINIYDEKSIVAMVNSHTNGLKLITMDKQLMKLCLEYIETPIEEREEEKKYRVRIPDSPERTPVYALCKLANGCVVINQTNESNFQEHDRYRLTESEIKRNHEYLWQFAKEIEMEGKDNE